jgi:hypothetical protein
VSTPDPLEILEAMQRFDFKCGKVTLAFHITELVNLAASLRLAMASPNYPQHARITMEMLLQDLADLAELDEPLLADLIRVKPDDADGLTRTIDVASARIKPGGGQN